MMKQIKLFKCFKILKYFFLDYYPENWNDINLNKALKYETVRDKFLQLILKITCRIYKEKQNELPHRKALE